MPTFYEGLGTERIVDETFAVLREQLNAALKYQQAEGDITDAALADRLGVPYMPLVIELVDTTPRQGFPYGNFHIGSIPSFVQTDDRVVNYPMVVVMPRRTVPDAEHAMSDQIGVYNSAVEIHCFGRANPTEGAEVAYRRSMRMAEAVHQVVSTDRSLRALVAGVSGPALVDRSEPWLFPSEDGHGDDWFWQAVMHQYQVKNYSQTPKEVQ
jgi:hypothetical protein